MGGWTRLFASTTVVLLFASWGCGQSTTSGGGDGGTDLQVGGMTNDSGNATEGTSSDDADTGGTQGSGGQGSGGQSSGEQSSSGLGGAQGGMREGSTTNGDTGAGVGGDTTTDSAGGGNASGAGGNTGGVLGSGGSTGGAMGSGGDGGAGGGTGGSGPIGIADLVGNLDGRLSQFPCCGEQPTTDDCGSCYYVDGVHNACQALMYDMVLDHPIGGIPGAIYDVTMHFYGIMSPKMYGDLAVRDAPDRPGSQNEGADPAPWAVGEPGMSIPGSFYNTYEVHVLDENMDEVGLYFLNADTEEGHFTYVINYERTIPVVGGGMVRLRSYNANCRIIKNCGATPGFPCAGKARILDLSEADPAPIDDRPMYGGLDQPSLGNSVDHGGQWWLVDVTAVEAR